MEFKEFKKLQQAHCATMLQNGGNLFRVGIDRDALWELYLDSFPPGTNEIYRERREFDCSCCRSFIKQFGDVCTIMPANEIMSIWDFETGSNKYDPVIQALSTCIHTAAVENVFITKERGFGTDVSRELLESGVHTWHHFRIDLPARLISNGDKSTAALTGLARDTRNVFQRSLEEITLDALDTVLDLIAEKTLYRGEEWQAALLQFRGLHQEYQSLPEYQRDNYCWRVSQSVGGVVGKIRNHSIGVLLQNISEHMDVEIAVKKYEHIIAPANYKRPKEIFTHKMVEQAEATVNDLGLTKSLGRRYAQLADITVNNVLWANRDAVLHMDGAGGIFAALKNDVPESPRQFEHVTGIAIENFMSSVLPNCTQLEVLFENRHANNLMSLVSPQDKDAPTLFKWDNAFSWGYNGNLADSSMKAQVKAAGGKVDGVLRYSIRWNASGHNPNDYDAHCKEPNGNHIFFGNKGRVHRSTGVLDVDIVTPGNRVAVENITWSDLRQMPLGVYYFFVHNYSHNGGRNGFDAEIEFDGQIFEYAYHKDLPANANVKVAAVKKTASGFEIAHALPTTTSSREIWNLKTNQFQPVSVALYSPNYWDGQGVGNRHYLFMLAGCENDTQPNGFFNEYLREDLLEHKRVFAALGSKMRVQPASEQLSGLGFSSTKRNSLIIKADGKPHKIIF